MKLARMPDGSPEIFHTIQGEGRNTGMPSVFIRSSLCNLHCQWCDTAYTWNWDGTGFKTESGEKFSRDEQIIDVSVPDLAARVLENFQCPNFVFTGGEPLIHQKDWTTLMQKIRQLSPNTGFHFEIETNGTLVANPEFLAEISQLNISPKLANSGVAEEKRIQPEALAFYASEPRADFKFVIENQADFSEMQEITRRFSIPPHRTFLMPKANSLVELETNSPAVAELCRVHGFRFSDRLHIRLFGAKRGV